MLDKKRLLQEIIAQLRREAEEMLAAAQATRDEATHEDNKAESKYDTRGLEASYLAEGQAKQAEEAEATLNRYLALADMDLSPAESIDVGSLVEVDLAGFRDLYFCGPGAGGKEIEYEGRECTIITRESPLGRHLYGARRGAQFEINGRAAKILLID